jgi:hypothetical protein
VRVSATPVPAPNASIPEDLAVAMPNSQAPVDHFEPGVAELQYVKGFQVQLDEMRKASEISDAFMTWLNPITSKSGPLEHQVYFILFRILAKMEADRGKAGLDQLRLERVKKALQSKDALGALQKIESELDAELKTRTDDQTRAVEGLITATRILNDALGSTLREMRGA